MAEEESAGQGFDVPKGNNLKYSVDKSVGGRINEDELFRKFCSAVEQAARRFAQIHRNDWIFILKESRDPESAKFQRTILHVQFSRVNFETSLKLWSTLSAEIRKELGETLARLNERDRERYSHLMSSFNVVLDY